jgi:phospholipid/cholesterol/gamma-HCH transport system substrate-binding protein
MRRLFTGGLLTLGLVGAAVFGVAAKDGGGSGYEIRAIFDDVASAVPGEDVKVAGAKVGKIGEMDVTPNKKASVILHIDDSGFTPFHTDAHCTIRPQSLIGEKYVECDPGTPSRPELRKIPDGLPGAGQHLLPLKNTSAPVDLDLVNDTMRLPTRQRLAILLSELGVGVAGRGKDLNELIHRANPALRQTDRVLAQLADENKVLANLATESDRALGPLARDRRSLSGFIRKANATGEATAARQADIQRSIQLLPETLRQIKPTLEDLGALSDEMTPVLTDLGTAAPSLSRFILQLGPFSRAATSSLTSLGKTTDVGGPVLKRAQPVVQDLKSFAHTAKPVSKSLDDLTASLDKSGGIEQFMNYIFFQVTAINGFDEISHYLRASLLVNVCSSYVTTEAPGCGAHLSQTASVSSTSAAAADKQLDNKGNVRASKATPAQALGTVVNGLLNLGANPDDKRLAQQRQQGLQRIRNSATKGSSPALDGAGGRDEALLNYLMGNGE